MGLLIFLFIIILIGIPIGISYLIYRWTKKREFDKKWRLLAFIPLIIAGYFFYTAICPDEDYYKNDFKEVTKMEFPKSGKILYKTASYPDQFGDYTSSFLAEFENDYLQKLEANVKKQGFVKEENKMSSEELDYIENRKGNRKYSAEYNKEVNGGKYYSVGFLNDNKTVVITRVSW